MTHFRADLYNLYVTRTHTSLPIYYGYQYHSLSSIEKLLQVSWYLKRKKHAMYSVQSLTFWLKNIFINF